MIGWKDNLTVEKNVRGHWNGRVSETMSSYKQETKKVTKWSQATRVEIRNGHLKHETVHSGTVYDCKRTVLCTHLSGPWRESLHLSPVNKHKVALTIAVFFYRAFGRRPAGRDAANKLTTPNRWSRTSIQLSFPTSWMLCKTINAQQMRTVNGNSGKKKLTTGQPNQESTDDKCEMKIMAAAGCGVSVLLWSVGAVGTLNEHQPTPTTTRRWQTEVIGVLQCCQRERPASVVGARHWTTARFAGKMPESAPTPHNQITARHVRPIPARHGPAVWLFARDPKSGTATLVRSHRWPHCAAVVADQWNSLRHDRLKTLLFFFKKDENLCPKSARKSAQVHSSLRHDERDCLFFHAHCTPPRLPTLPMT